MDRQEGYYWVKFGDGYTIAQFTITQKMSGKSSTWSLFCDDNAYTDGDFEHINEIRIKEPGELPEF
jgi:hypothetical protein